MTKENMEKKQPLTSSVIISMTPEELLERLTSDFRMSVVETIETVEDFSHPPLK